MFFFFLNGRCGKKKSFFLPWKGKEGGSSTHEKKNNRPVIWSLS